MFQQPRKPTSLQILEVLRNRTQLSVEQQNTYERLIRGYIGEKKLAAFLKSELHQPHIPIYDLQLKIGNSECQLDSLLIFQQEIYLLEVKNYQGDFYIEDNHWFIKTTQKEINNPLYQLKRNELLLQEFFIQQQIPLKIKAYVVFVHPGFHLYQSPLDSPIIYPSQLKRFASKLRSLPNQLHDNHQKIANQLTTNHIAKSSYEKIPEYEYHQLKKDAFCKHCRGEIRIERGQIVCHQCHQIELLENAIIRNTLEFNLLFPNKKITTDTIYTWCGKISSKRNIQRILSKHFQLLNAGKWSHYTLK